MKCEGSNDCNLWEKHRRYALILKHEKEKESVFE